MPMRKYLFIAILVILTLLFAGCATDDGSNDEFKEVLVERVSPVVTVPTDPRAEIICDAAAAQTKLESFGFSSDTIRLYDEAYFEVNDLVAVLMITGVSYEEYYVEALTLSGKELHITLLEKAPRYTEDLAVCKGLLIDVEKGIYTENMNVVVKINTEKE